MVSSYINALKSAKGFTAQQIADASGVPLATVKRILAGNTENPTFDNVADIVRALGGSLDEMCGIESERKIIPLSQDDNTTSFGTNRHLVIYMQSQASALVTQLRETLAHQNRITKWLIIALCALFLMWGLQWLIDGLIPDYGWIQRDAWLEALYFQGMIE